MQETQPAGNSVKLTHDKKGPTPYQNLEHPVSVHNYISDMAHLNHGKRQSRYWTPKIQDVVDGQMCAAASLDVPPKIMRKPGIHH